MKNVVIVCYHFSLPVPTGGRSHFSLNFESSLAPVNIPKRISRPKLDGQVKTYIITKPTKLPKPLSKDSDQPGYICPFWSEVSKVFALWVARDPNPLHANSEDSDQTGHRLCCAGLTGHCVVFGMLRLNYQCMHTIHTPCAGSKGDFSVTTSFGPPLPAFISKHMKNKKNI